MAVDLEPVLRAQQRGCEIGGSALYSRVLEAVVADVRAGGPCAAVLAPFAHEPPAEAAALRFLAAVHELVLAGDAPELARHYPSAGGRPGDGLEAAFVAVVAAHEDGLRARTAAPIQTNEVGRAAALVGGLLTVAGTGLPVRLLEVGASAGLNLRLDRYRYEGRSGAHGPPSSPVVFDHPWVDAEPRLDAPLDVVERRGCDTAPLDPTDEDDRLRLRACLWPDQPHRRRRLDAALEAAAAVPAPVARADAVTWLGEELGRPAEGTVTVVVHSIVAQYLGEEGRERLRQVITAAGEEATTGAPVAWLRMEPATATEAEVRLTLWPRPAPVRTHALARCGFHGPPVRWLAAG